MSDFMDRIQNVWCDLTTCTEKQLELCEAVFDSSATPEQIEAATMILTGGTLYPQDLAMLKDFTRKERTRATDQGLPPDSRMWSFICWPWPDPNDKEE